VEEKGKGAVVYGQPVYSLLEPLLPETGRLYVSPDPSEARIRVLNIQPPFEQGMRLAPGHYQLEVSADGYQTQTQWINLEAGADKNVPIHLAKIEAGAQPVARTAPEYQQSAKAPQEKGSLRSILPTARTDRFIKMLRSGRDEQIRLAAREAMRRHPRDPHLLAAANEALLEGYLQKTDNGMHIDAMAWLCKYLGNSGDTDYLSTLKTVSTGKVHRKLKSYAQRSYEILTRQSHARRRR
jgi:hypothetical protein